MKQARALRVPCHTRNAENVTISTPAPGVPTLFKNPATQCPRICCAAKLQMLRNARSPERRGVSATLKPSHAHQETETRALRRGFTERARRFYIMKKRSRRARSPETPRRAGPQRTENRRIRPLFALIKNRDKRGHRRCSACASPCAPRKRRRLLKPYLRASLNYLSLCLSTASSCRRGSPPTKPFLIGERMALSASATTCRNIRLGPGIPGASRVLDSSAAFCSVERHYRAVGTLRPPAIRREIVDNAANIHVKVLA